MRRQNEIVMKWDATEPPLGLAALTALPALLYRWAPSVDAAREWGWGAEDRRQI